MRIEVTDSPCKEDEAFEATPPSSPDSAAGMIDIICTSGLMRWNAKLKNSIARTPFDVCSMGLVRARRKGRLRTQLRQPIQFDLLPKQDSLVRPVVVVHPHVVQIGTIRNSHEAGILRLGINQRKVLIGPVAFRLAPEHLILGHRKLRLAPMNEIR